MAKTFYLTTPLYYINGVPHVGHTYTTVIADAIARYKRMCGLEVCLLTGTDEHGLKIERAAREEGLTPKQLADKNASAFKDAWQKLGLTYDKFIRTTEEKHHETVKDLFKRIQDQGYIYLGEYSGYYCVRDEAYVPEGETICPDCGRPTEFVTEESYFFKLSAFQDRLLRFYEENPEFVVPRGRMNEIVSFVKGGLNDLSISRTSFRWGIPVPANDKHIFYVWFDALTGYLSGVAQGLDSADFKQYWPADVQLIGKDILRFHAVYWPAFLLAAGLQPPRQLLVHGWWTVDGEKMSKSRGNFITAQELIELLRPDYIRYFLLRELPIGADGNFSYEGVLNRINSDLANDLGNLSSRLVKMIDNYFDGKIPGYDSSQAASAEVAQQATDIIWNVRELFDRWQINKALDAVWELIAAANKYIVTNEPWAIARDRSKATLLGTVLYNSAEMLRISALLLAPVIPDGAAQILKQLGITDPLDRQRISDLKWGQLQPGMPLGVTEMVYPRVDPKEFLQRAAETRRTAQAAAAVVGDSQSPAAAVQTPAGDSGERIGIEDFAKVQMRVGKIISAERVPKSEKLIKLMVNIGSETRQVVAGIGKEYDPATLPGRLVVIVTNLKPTKLMGVESDGMIVAATAEGGRPVLATFIEPVAPGSRLK